MVQLREADTDWKRFLLHLPQEKFDPRKELEFRLFWPYSCGIPDQWLSHLIDVVPWLTGDPFPRSCVASGGIYFMRDGRKNPDTFTAAFQYPTGFQVVFQSSMKSPEPGVREVYRSADGKLDFQAGPPAAGGEGEAGTSGHLRNFLECLRERRTPSADIHAGFQHSVAVCMAIEAFHTGKRITYDPLKEKLAGA